MPMVCMKTTTIVIKHSISLASDSGYIKTKYSVHVEVSVRENPSIIAASLCQEVHWEEEEKRAEMENIRGGINIPRILTHKIFYINVDTSGFFQYQAS